MNRFAFLLKLSRFLGFAPHEQTRIDQKYFDLQEGGFTSLMPVHPYFIDKFDADYFLLLFSTPFEKINEIKFDVNRINQLLGTNISKEEMTNILEKLEIKVEGDKVQVTREVDGGLQTVELTLPAIITTDLRLNEPRYAKLPNIMKAKKKPLDEKTPADFGVDMTSKQEIIKVVPPSERKAGIKVGSVDELVDKLKNEAKVI